MIIESQSQSPCNDHYSCDYAGRPRNVETLGGVVAADHGDCSEIGADVLKVGRCVFLAYVYCHLRLADTPVMDVKAGGHAVDAAVAAAFCQGVMNPFASGLGGGKFPRLVHTVWAAPA